MLVLTRRQGESIIIGDNIEIRITRVEGDVVKVGIQAPRNVTIFRKEVLETIESSNKTAALSSTSGPQLPSLPKLPGGLKLPKAPSLPTPPPSA